METAHNPLTHGRPVAWVQEVAPPTFTASLPGDTFWAAGVIDGRHPPEHFFPGATTVRAFKLNGGCFVALMQRGR
jgi:hypothetical protein